MRYPRVSISRDVPVEQSSVAEEFPIGGGETVDLAIIGKRKKVAVEIETGKSDAIGNIRKCLKAGFEVLSVAVNADILKKIESDTASLAFQDRKLVRLVNIFSL